MITPTQRSVIFNSVVVSAAFVTGAVLADRHGPLRTAKETVCLLSSTPDEPNRLSIVERNKYIPDLDVTVIFGGAAKMDRRPQQDYDWGSVAWVNPRVIKNGTILGAIEYDPKTNMCIGTAPGRSAAESKVMLAFLVPH